MHLPAGMTLLDKMVLGAGALCLLALLLQVWRTAHRLHRPILASAAGAPWRGVVYAFTLGMLPGAKESARKHLPTYLAGIVYHAGAFAALAKLAAAVFGFALPPAMDLAASGTAGAGLLAGLGLLAKRATHPVLTRLSLPDDYAANLLVDLFLMLSLLESVSAGWHAAWLVSAVILFLYIPCGKIRHCAYFFYARAVFGLTGGRRGVFPDRAGSVKP